MNAIDMLEAQHREIEDLFAKLDRAKDVAKKEKAFIELADRLAVHASIEEHHFYPAVRERPEADGLLDTFDDHLAIKRALSALLDTGVEDPSFELKLDALEAEVAHHLEEEEGDLFPRVMRIFDETELEDIGDAMAAEQAELEENGNPREAVSEELDKVAPI